MSSLHGFIFKKGLKEIFSQICRSAGRVPRIRKRKSGLGPFNIIRLEIENRWKDEIGNGVPWDAHRIEIYTTVTWSME